MSNPPICVLLTTYNRTECALQTVRAIKQNLQWDQLWWWVSDDGSLPSHVNAVVNEIGPSYHVEVFNSERRGVGYGMNHSLRRIFDTTDLVLVMEDDWVLHAPLDLTPYVRTLMNHEEHGYIRFGYISPNILGYLISEEGKLFWRIEPNQETYRMVGHPSLRHKRFHHQYGWYDEGLAPGLTELSMGGKVNQKPNGPNLLYPVECGAFGFWGHIGSESLADISPER